jgi:hypothetical protein
MAITQTSAGLKDSLTSTLGLPILPLLRFFMQREVSQELLRYCRTDCTRSNILPFCCTRLKQAVLNTTTSLQRCMQISAYHFKTRSLPLARHTTRVILKFDAAKSIVHHRHHKSPQLNPISKQCPFRGIFYVSNPHYTGFNTWITG